jgi:hypothetical protein
LLDNIVHALRKVNAFSVGRDDIDVVLRKHILPVQQ